MQFHLYSTKKHIFLYSDIIITFISIGVSLSSPHVGTTTHTGQGDQCPQGSACPANSTYPTQCVAGTYADVVGMAECKVCPQGTFCGGGTIIPEICPTGHYCPEGTMSKFQFPCPKGTYNNVNGKIKY